MRLARVLLPPLAILAFFAVVLAASHYGEKHRCDTLMAQQSAAASVYGCPTPAGR